MSNSSNDVVCNVCKTVMIIVRGTFAAFDTRFWSGDNYFEGDGPNPLIRSL